MSGQHERTRKALDRVVKWRTLFAGWQLGTRPKGDPECDAVRDHRELSILLRVESSAVAAILIEKGVCTREEWAATLESEAHALERGYEARFPGVTASDDGLVIDGAVAVAWMARRWRP